MKYWVFQNNQVNGPFESVELSQLSGFTADSLVCPEGRRGTSMGDWQRANLVAELSVPLMKASQVAAAVAAPAAASPAPSGLPPEPTLRDLAALGSLQEKLSSLERTVAHLRDDLDRKETEILGLHTTIDGKDRRAEELSAKLAGLEQRLESLTGLRENLDKAVAAEREMESSVKRQSQTIEDLSREIEVLKAQKKAAKTDEDTFRSLPPPKKEEPRFEPPTLAIPAPKEEPKFEPPALVIAPPQEEPKLEPPILIVPPPVFEAPPPKAAGRGEELPRLEEATLLIPPPSAPELAAPPMPETSEAPAEPGHKVIGSREDLTREMKSMKAKKQKELEEATMRVAPAFPEPLQQLAEPMTGTALPSSLQPLGGMGSPSPAQSEPAPAAEKPAARPKKKILIGALAAVGALAVLGLLFKAGLLGRHGAPQAPAAPSEAAPELAPQAPSPEEQAEQLKQLSIEIVRAWAGPDGGRTVGQLLETGAPETGKLSPWMAEKIKDDLYQVNFYAPKTSENAPAAAYEFQALLGTRQVVPMNEAAKALLSPPPPLNVPSSEALGQGGVSSRRPARKKQKRKSAKPIRIKAKSKPEPASLDEMLLPGIPPKPEPAFENAQSAEEPEADAPSAEAPAEKPAKKKSDGKSPADAQLLDDLLKP